MDNLARSKNAFGWQPSQNQAFFIIVVGMVLAAVFAWLL